MTYSPAAVVQALVEAGVTGDALVTALKKIEDASSPAKSPGAERTARWRKRHEASQNVTCDAKRGFDKERFHTSKEITSPKAGLGSAREASEALERQLREAAGWESEPAPNLAVTGPVEALIAAGAILEIDVLPVVRALAPRARSRVSWKFFIPAIVQARDDRIAASKAVSVPSQANPQVPRNGPRKHSRAENFAILDAIIAEAERRENGGGGEGSESLAEGAPGHGERAA